MQVNLDSHVREKGFDCSSTAMMCHRSPPSKSIMVILKDLLMLPSTSPSEAQLPEHGRTGKACQLHACLGLMPSSKIVNMSTFLSWGPVTSGGGEAGLMKCV